MKRILWTWCVLVALLVIVAGCANVYTPSSASAIRPLDATTSGQWTPQSMLPTYSATPSPTGTPDLYAEVRVSQTAVSLQQTQVAMDMQGVSITQGLINIQLTVDQATQQGQMNINSTAQAALGVIQSQTAGAPSTQIAGTTTAYAVVREAKIEQQKFWATVVGIWIGKISLAVLALIFLAGIFYAAWIGLSSWHFKLSQIEPDEHGRFKVVAESAIPGKQKRLVNPNLAHRATISQETDDLNTEQALLNAQSQRNLEGIRALVEVFAYAKRMLKSLTQDPAAKEASLPNAGMDIQKIEPPMLYANSMRDLPLPEWSRMGEWDGKMMTYGVGRNNQLLLADPKEEPHWMIVGRTRSYKSRGGLRTLSVSALTMGYQMLFIGKRVDFFPFEGHPNAKIVPVDLLNDPEAYLETLRKVAALMKQRDDYLTERRMSIWQQTGRPQLYVVLDEFSAAVRQLNFVRNGAGNLVSSMATALVQEGAKYGISIIQVVQDATGKNVDISARRNMGKMVFRLSEQRASEVALGVSEPSAVGLPNRYFLSSIGEGANITLGVSFAPSDEEVQSFLREHQVPALEPMDWIEGSVVEDGQQGADGQKSKGIEEKKIIDAYLEYVSRKEDPNFSEIERTVWGIYRGGSFFRKIKKVIAEFEGTTTATPENMPKTGTLSSSSAQ